MVNGQDAGRVDRDGRKRSVHAGHRRFDATAGAFLVSALLCTGRPALGQSVEDAAQLLSGGDRSQLEMGIQSLGLIGSAEALPPLAQRIRAGLPPDLLETAIITVAALGQKDAGGLLFELMSHRRPLIRLRTVEAIIALQPDGAEAGLVAALSDSDLQVRDAAARGLGEFGTPGSLDVLYQALDKGNMEASKAIGRLTPPSQIRRITGYLGRIPLRSLRSAFTEVLRRRDVSVKTKLQTVGILQEVGTPEVRDFFNDVLASATDDDPLHPKVGKALLTAIRGIPD
ncbi:MAG: HEAT repeat domain-containing protein [Myxococcales bacterium]|nr:HEAT repeat domain-containing protein [Myxococcales bacterium]MDD9971774.1 HEAT repeat domain-containing protein [Myxococcales bacterium]